MIGSAQDIDPKRNSTRIMPDFARGPFPSTRMRRHRAHAWSRRMVEETSLAVSDLIWPLFVLDQQDSESVPSLPGVSRLGTKDILKAVEYACELEIPAIAIFPRYGSELEDRRCSGSNQPR